jgi:hypothetical protein
MKTMIVAAAALAMGMGTAVANGRPCAPASLFTIWSMQSHTGQPFTPTSESMRMARNGERINFPAPRAFAQGPPAKGAPGAN